MARHGVWQLSKLTVTYCEFSGSSRGTRRATLSPESATCAEHGRRIKADIPAPRREFLEAVLPVFREQNPQLAIETRTNPGHHPWLKAEYRAPLLAFPHLQHLLDSTVWD
jgi:large subunit ribosomal protein L43